MWQSLLDPLFGNRYFRFAFWMLVIAMVSGIAFVLLRQLGTVDNMELSLLDLKTRHRTEHFTGPENMPSKDIVVLGIDGHTDRYMRLHRHPQLQVTLPRDILAEVVDYLTAQGAKTVIFDLEFKDEKPAQDKQLAAAIARNRHAYAAARIVYPLHMFVSDHEQQQFFWNHQADSYLASHKYLDTLFFMAVLRPYTIQLSQMRSRWMPFSFIDPMDLGFGPFVPVGRPDSELALALAGQTRFLNGATLPARLFSDAAMPPALPNSPDWPAFGDIRERFYAEACTNYYYENSFRNNKRFLDLLASDRLNIHLQKAVPEVVDRQMTRCYIYPVVTSIMENLAGVGVPSIEYDNEDAYIRSASVLFRGYRGNFYTYLGIRPALDLLNVSHAAYTPEALFLDNRQIPLLDGWQVVINWRHPRLLAEGMFDEAGIPWRNDPGLRRQIESVAPARSNPLLGGGHIYRQISMIDILRTIAHDKKSRNGLSSQDPQNVWRFLAQEPMNPAELGRLSRIPFHEASGKFSFKDKIVIIGNTITDIHRTPMSDTMFGPEVVAATLDMMLHDTVFVQKPPVVLQWMLITLLCIGIAVAVVGFENLSIGFTVGIVLISLFWVINFLAFCYLGYWLDTLVPTFALGFSLTAATLYRYYIHDQEKHHLTSVFSKYVSPQIMEEIVRNPEKALDNLRGGKKELTVLFSDLHGFTHLFENTDPEIMVNQLNEYFDVMTEIILSHGGTYDKYMGDSIMAFFGAPADLPNHAEMACRAAIEMENALRRLNEVWAREGSRILAHGIGISSGEMFVGNFGSKNIKNFTVMGSNVNLGSRLEAYTRIAHWPIIISTGTWELVKDKIEVRDLGRIQVKGFTDRVQVYGLEKVKSRLGDVASIVEDAKAG